MENQGVHWRMGGKLTNCGCEILPNGNDILYIIIAKIEYKNDHIINGRKEHGVWVATFANNEYTKLPMILNATNRKRLVKMYQTEYLEKLENIAVRLTREKTRDVQDGGETWGLRIHKDKPKPPALPTLTNKSEQWESVKAAFIDKKADMTYIKSRFKLSQETENELLNLLKDE